MIFGYLTSHVPVVLCRSTAMSVTRDLLSVPLRLYIYGLHGFFTEVIFTAIWDFVLKQDFRFHGKTTQGCGFHHEARPNFMFYREMRKLLGITVR